MKEPKTPTLLTRLAQDFRDVRGLDRDAAWAEEVFLALALQGATPTATREILAPALDLVRTSGEGPDALFGDAREFAREQIAERHEAGLPTQPPDPQAPLGDIVVVGLAMASVFAALVMIVFGIRSGGQIDLTGGLVGLMVLMPITALGSVTVFESVLARRRLLIAAGCSLGFVAVGIGIQAALFAAQDRLLIATVPTWTLIFAVLGFAALAAVLARVLPEPTRRSPSRQLDDEQWQREAAGLLRLRADLPEARVRRILDDAIDHTTQAGQSLQSEFGTPETFVARFPRDKVAAARRKLLLYICLAPAPLLLAFGDMVAEQSWSAFSWTGTLILVMWVWFVVDAAKGFRAARNAHREASASA